MGQFWLDVFRCQAGQNITRVDDLSTAAVETHECSVSISMNETHITITTNGLPDHDFESTLACTQANDCTRSELRVDRPTLTRQRHDGRARCHQLS